MFLRLGLSLIKSGKTTTRFHTLPRLSVLFLLSTPISVSSFAAMTWANTWDDILQGGPTRWKVDDVEIKKLALARILEYFPMNDAEEATAPKLKILCPLAGDDPFVRYAWSQGHDVTAIDLVPAAVDAMRRQFTTDDAEWTCTKTDNTIVWTHSSGRATLYAGDMMQQRPELNGQFDAVYDKDSFGALPLELRSSYCQRLSEYCKPNHAIVYTEVKQKEGGHAAGGPPFHVVKSDLMEATSFGNNFDHVADLGEVYPISVPSAKQTAHILRRK